jgi:hypothetical protein
MRQLLHTLITIQVRMRIPPRIHRQPEHRPHQKTLIMPNLASLRPKLLQPQKRILNQIPRILPAPTPPLKNLLHMRKVRRHSRCRTLPVPCQIAHVPPISCQKTSNPGRSSVANPCQRTEKSRRTTLRAGNGKANLTGTNQPLESRTQCEKTGRCHRRSSAAYISAPQKQYCCKA